MTRRPNRPRLTAPPDASVRRWVPPSWSDIDNVRLTVAEASVHDCVRQLAGELLSLTPASKDNAAQRAQLASLIRQADADYVRLSSFHRAFIESVIAKYARWRKR